ncbi:hypothetical protein [Nonlabens spongiae]|nr:hypothetical protein [Nonlabens spongiae]
MKHLLFFMSLCIAFVGCSEGDDNQRPTSSNCDMNVVLSNAQFQNAPADQISIDELIIDGDCLKISFSSSGCDGNSWEVKLIDSETIAESFPPQRDIRLSLRNIEVCQAIISKEISFDISNLQVDGNQVFLNIANNGARILYEY